MIYRTSLLRFLPSLRRNASRRSTSTKSPSPTNPNLSSTPTSRSPLYDSRPLSFILTATQVVLIYHLIQAYGIELSSCAGPSMVPALSAKGDWIAINKWYRRGRGVKVGDIVDFMHPVIPGAGAVKRVIGMPGDFVVSNYSGDGEGDNGSLKMVVRGGEGIVEKVGVGSGNRWRMIQVPKGHCWLLGDNLAESRDSRTYGPLPLALIKGKVIARVLPLGQIGWTGNKLKKVEDDL